MAGLSNHAKTVPLQRTPIRKCTVKSLQKSNPSGQNKRYRTESGLQVNIMLLFFVNSI